MDLLFGSLGIFFLISIGLAFYQKTMIKLRLYFSLGLFLVTVFSILKGEYILASVFILILPINIFRLIQMKNMIKNAKSSNGQVDTYKWLRPYTIKEIYKKGQYLFRQGDSAGKVYYIKQGVLNLVEINKKIGEGILIGETGIFSTKKQRTVSALCETDVELFSLSHDKIIQLFFQNPTFGFRLARLSIMRFIENYQKENSVRVRIESELKVAHSIQTSMLPDDFPVCEEFELSAMCNPAKEVGGDFYDFFMINEDKLFFTIGDVSGKGVPAALFMVITKTLIKTIAMQDHDPDQILTQVNSLLIPENEELMFVTLFCAVLDIRTGQLKYTSAGHNPPLVSTENNEIKYLELKKSFVLGALNGVKFTTCSMKLNPNDIIYIYTDGVTEAMNNERKLYSEQRLLTTINDIKDKRIDEILSGIERDVDLFVEGADQSDDMTMLIVRYKGNINVEQE